MVLKQRLMVCAGLARLMAGIAMPATAAPWTRGFVVGAYEYAFRYGGRSDYSRGAEVEPGVDCPHGSTVFMASPEQTRAAIARQPGQDRGTKRQRIVSAAGAEVMHEGSIPKMRQAGERGRKSTSHSHSHYGCGFLGVGVGIGIGVDKKAHIGTPITTPTPSVSFQS